MIPEAAARAIGRPLVSARRVAGGDINEAWQVELGGGVRAFVKSRPRAKPGEYATEAAGLRWLGEAEHGLPVPEVLAVGDVSGSGSFVRDPDDPGSTGRGGSPARGASGSDGVGPSFLALSWIDAGALGERGEEALGRGIAHIHAAGARAFGAPPPGAPNGGLRIGDVELPAAESSDWPAFYGEHRLAPLLRAASDRGALPSGGARAVVTVIERLAGLAGPPEPPARLHGDLWRGNVLAAADGRPHLIDPAAHGGHREVDLAMLRLFGGPSPRMLGAYQEVHPLADGHERRLPLWQLFPLLVHAVLFGGGYGASAERAAAWYG